MEQASGADDDMGGGARVALGRVVLCEGCGDKGPIYYDGPLYFHAGRRIPSGFPTWGLRAERGDCPLCGAPVPGAMSARDMIVEEAVVSTERDTADRTAVHRMLFVGGARGRLPAGLAGLDDDLARLVDSRMAAAARRVREALEEFVSCVARGRAPAFRLQIAQ